MKNNLKKQNKLSGKSHLYGFKKYMFGLICLIVASSCQKQELSALKASVKDEDKKILEEIKTLSGSYNNFLENGTINDYLVGGEEKARIIQNTINYWHSTKLNLKEFTKFESTYMSEYSAVELYSHIRNDLYRFISNDTSKLLSLARCEYNKTTNKITVKAYFVKPNHHIEPKGVMGNGWVGMPNLFASFSSIFYNQPNGDSVGYVSWDLLELRKKSDTSLYLGNLIFNNYAYPKFEWLLKDLFEININFYRNLKFNQNALEVSANKEITISSKFTWLNVGPPAYYYNLKLPFDSSYANVNGLEKVPFYYAGTGKYDDSIGGCQVANWNIDTFGWDKSYLRPSLLDNYLYNFLWLTDAFANHDEYAYKISDFYYISSSGQCNSAQDKYNSYLAARIWAIKCDYNRVTTITQPPIQPIAPVAYPNSSF